jgi:hypothetical protein
MNYFWEGLKRAMRDPGAVVWGFALAPGLAFFINKPLPAYFLWLSAIAWLAIVLHLINNRKEKQDAPSDNDNRPR